MYPRRGYRPVGDATPPIWHATTRAHKVSPLRWTAVLPLVVLPLVLAVAGCGATVPSSPATEVPPPSAPPPSDTATSTATDLSAIGCATKDPEDGGDLTGAWQGDDHGVYYIRQVGDCLWWFGTEIRDIEPGVTGQAGFANVASGRLTGTDIEVEWADLPVGNILGGGGLSLVYDRKNDRLRITEQRGDWIPFGASTLTRIRPEASPEPSASASASP
jgi:hypothetical protein